MFSPARLPGVASPLRSRPRARRTRGSRSGGDTRVGSLTPNLELPPSLTLLFRLDSKSARVDQSVFSRNE